MSTEQNKAVVRRFITEVLAGWPRRSGRRPAGRGLRGTAGWAAWTAPASRRGCPPSRLAPGGRMEIEDLVAEGDAVVARFTYAITLRSGEKTTARGLHLRPSRRWQDRGG